MAHYIIIEGPDGAGKTSLVNSLAKIHENSEVIHFGAPTTDEDAYNYYTVYAAEIQKHAHTNKVVIFDRSWLSDRVYAPIMRNRIEMTKMHSDMLSAMVVASGGGLVIYCTAATRTLWNRCKHRGEAYIPDEQTLTKVSAMYAEIMLEEVYLPVIRYDTAAKW